LAWLIAVDIKIRGILIKTFTREFYELPPFSPYDDNVDAVMTVLVKKVSMIMLMGLEIALGRRCTLVFKAILSHDPKEKPEFLLMILVGVGYSRFLEALHFNLDSSNTKC
jgi:hypothetical protein